MRRLSLCIIFVGACIFFDTHCFLRSYFHAKIHQSELYLFGDKHQKSDEQEQIDQVVSFLSNYDQQNSKRMHVLVEEPLPFVKATVRAKTLLSSIAKFISPRL